VTSQPAVCFGCSRSLEQEPGTSVGDAVFCAGCLGRMLRRVDERGAAAPGNGAGGRPTGATGATGATAGAVARPAVAAATPADAPCFVCGEPLAGDAAIELRGFAICASCARGLIGDAAAPVVAAADDDAAAAPAPAEVQPEHIQLTPGSATEWCSGCGRAMPGPGSYRLLDGRPTCAACVAARGRAPGASSAAADAAAAPAVCDACARPAAPSSLRDTDGFWLCAACRSSDPELAVALARARHQRRLARASRRLLDGEDE